MNTCYICGEVVTLRTTWRVTRSPDTDIEVTEMRVHGQPEPIAIRVDGPTGHDLCGECWHAAEGFLIELRGTRRMRVRV